MTQIFTGSGLGIHNSSLSLGSYGPKGSAALGQGGTSVYVNAANGNVVLRQSDGFLANAGLGLDLFQTYNSQGEMRSSWCFNLQSRIEYSGGVNQAGSIAVRVDEDGHRSRFVWDPVKQTYRPEEGGTARLSCNSQGWTYKEGSQKTSFLYNTQGQLTQIQDADGHRINFCYEQGQLSSITDVYGKQKITWTFNQGLLEDVRTSSEGQVIHHLHYEYDGQHRLHQVTRDLGQGKSYRITYNYAGDSNLISDIRQSDGTSLHLDYDAQGRIKKLTDGEGRISTYEYAQGHTTLTNGLGESWTYYYDERQRLTSIEGPEHYRIRYEYEGNQLSRVMQGNQVWDFTYTEEGDCIRLEEPNGQITLRTYDAAHHLLSETRYTAFDGKHHPINPQTTHYLYDKQGHLLFVLSADGTVTEHRYNDQGQLVNTRCYLHAAYILGEQDALSPEELYAWTVQQNPQKISLTEYRYDWRGQLTEEIHYSQVASNGLGLPESAVRTLSLYDAAGRLIEKSTLSAKGWSTTHYVYDDLGRLIQTLDNQQHSQSIEYDDAHQRILQTDANGLRTLRLYDRSGLLLSTQHLDATHTYGSTLYRYDAAGRLIAETGPEGTSSYSFYNAQGRLQAQLNAQGQLTEYRYTEEGLLLQSHRYAQRINSYDWQGRIPRLEDIRPQTSPKDEFSLMVYDQYQQIAYRINAQGAVIGYTYDAQGHVLSQTAYAHRLADFNPEHLLSYAEIKLNPDTHDRVFARYYNLQGRLVAEINGEGCATAYTYNRLGLLIETCRYTNKAIKPLSGDWAQDKPAEQPKKDLHTYSLYDAQGLKIADVDAEGYLTEFIYGSDGLIQQRIAYAQALPKPLNLDENTLLETIRPQPQANDHSTTYSYNDLNQLIEEKTHSGLITTYEYNESGQVTVKTLCEKKNHTLRQQRTRYDALGRIIQQLDAQGAALLQQPDLSSTQIEAIWKQHSICYNYTLSGLIESKTDALQHTTRYFYNEYQQLQYTLNAEGGVTETNYNAQGQLESTRKYNAFLTGMDPDLSTQDLKIRLSLLKNDHFDETTSYEYNSLGQLTLMRTGMRGLTTSSYNVFGELESRTQNIDAQRHETTTYAYDRRGLLLQSTEDSGGLNRKTATEYDAFGWVTKRTDGCGNETKYTRNKKGQHILLFNAKNQFQSIIYDAFERVLSETDFGSKIVKRYIYEDQENRFILSNPQTHTQVVTQYNALGDKIAFTDAKGLCTEFHYDAQGQLLRVDSPEHAFKAYHYNEIGQLIWQEDAGGHIITYTYDAENHLLSQTQDPQGLNLTTRYQYDALGRQIQITDAKGCIKQLTYDSQGRLIQSCIDTQGLNHVQQFTYDDRGLLLRQTEYNPQGIPKVIAYEWDNLGRRCATITDPEGLNLRNTYEYDAQNNLTVHMDANGHSTHYAYDVLNQCRYEIDACGRVTEHKYNKDGNEIQTVRYAKSISALSEYREALVKAAIQEDGQKDQYHCTSFDDAGRIFCSYDARGYATLYQYDDNGNVIKTIQYAQAVSLEALKRGGTPTPSGVGRSTYFAYDELNQLRFQADTNGYLTQSRYDASGQLISRTRYAHAINLNGSTRNSLDYFKEHLIQDSEKDQTQRYAYDQAGRLCLEVSAQGVAKSYEYNELNQLISTTTHALMLPPSDALITLEDIQKNANDRSTRYIYDAAGREVYRISAEGQVMERRYDALGNVLTQITHSQRIALKTYTEDTINQALGTEEAVRKNHYAYDAAGRLVEQTNALGDSTHYIYDAQDHVLQKIEANHAIWAYRYDETNQLIESISPLTSVTTAQGQETRSIITRIQYDSFGNVLSEIRDATGIQYTRLYEYDNSNQCIKTIYPDVKVNHASPVLSNQRQEISLTLVEETQYNAFGEVIASCDKAGHWTHYVYNDQGLLFFSVDTLGGLTEYRYDALGRAIKKTRYATPIHLDKDKEYTALAIGEAKSNSPSDRHETFQYDLDNQLIQSSGDEVRAYNPQTNNYYRMPSHNIQKTYNAFGEVLCTATRLNETEWAYTYAYYNKDGQQIALIDAQGYLSTTTYTAFGEAQSMTEYALPVSRWDSEHYTNPQSSSKDRKVRYTYDALGQLTCKTLEQVTTARIKNGQIEQHTADLSTHYSYDALGHLTQTTDAQGNTAYCYYDAQGQLIAQVAPQTQDGRAATTYAYDALGNLVETRRWALGALEADAAHFRVRGESTQDLITRREYDAQGLLLSETDGLNHRIEYSYDANGNLARSFQTLTQAHGGHIIQDKRYTYDSEQHLLQTATFKTQGGIQTEDAQYSIFGELIAKGVDGHYSIHVDYDHAGRIWRSNTQGFYQIFVYDAADHVTQVVTSTNDFHPNHGEWGVDLSEKYFTENSFSFDKDTWNTLLQRQNNTYDALGRVLSQTREFTLHFEVNSPIHYATQTQTLDRWGNMLSHTNALGYETRYEYNALNEVITQELPEVSVMDEHGTLRSLKPVNRYAYDELGRMIAFTDAQGHCRFKEYDAAGQVIAETDAKGAVRSKHYTLLNQMDWAKNELGGVTRYTYDKANRLLSLNTPKTAQSYVYDEAGQLIQQNNGVGDSTFFDYDSLGHQITRYDTKGHMTSYEYDNAGHKIKETDALGNSQSWAYTEEGRLQQHRDLGAHLTEYQYNTNGLLIHETSSLGKNVHYYYEGDGTLAKYADETQMEVVTYSYDAEGQIISKESSRAGDYQRGWLCEKDLYQYDALGRLVQVRRRHPDDTDSRFPDKDQALLSIDYDYDALGNIRHINLRANESGYHPLTREEYYTYDENNRILINKGQLVDGNILMSQDQGSTLSYDAAGNIIQAQKYEKKLLQDYHYVYNQDNQLELTQKNGVRIQTKEYDAAGRVITERGFNTKNHLAQKNILIYDQGFLVKQDTLNEVSHEESKSSYLYDAVGNMTQWKMDVKGGSTHDKGYTLIHQYRYALWDDYKQLQDESRLITKNSPTTYGTSTHVYDVNGLLQDVLDSQRDRDGQSNTTHYWNSALDGIKAREGKEGRTTYLNVAGKTIGDVHNTLNGTQELNVYSGFTPSGSPEHSLFAFDFIQNRHKLKAFISGQKENSTPIEVPQDNLGTYTLEAGDTLESIALQVYGDSGLWYLIADANGITDRNAVAGEEGQLHLGQRLNIPPVATGQHQTNATHKVLNAHQKLGNTSATTPLPPPPPPRPQAHSILGQIVVAVVAVVATVLTAGALGALAGGAASSFSALFSTGLSVLGGGVLSTTTGTLAAGFTAGFVGSMASQGIATALNMQQGIDFNSALITGLATAATAGLGHALDGTPYAQLNESLKSLPINKEFNLSSALEIMEQNTTSQSLNLLLRRHQHFDWTELAAAGLTAGILGGSTGKSIDSTLKQIDHGTGILSTELKSLIHARTQSTTSGTHFDAIQALTENLGTAIGNTIGNTIGNASTQEKTLAETLDELSFEDDLKQMELEKQAFNNYLAKQLNGSEGYGELLANEHYEYCPIPETREQSRSTNTPLLYNSEPSDVFEYPLFNLLNNNMFLHKETNPFSSIENVWATLNSEYETNVDFSVLLEYEGGQVLQAYLPMHANGKIIGNSGITIATGFDIGQHSESEIKKFNFPETLEKKLLPFVNATKEQAKDLLSLASQIELSNEEANRIDFEIKGAHLKSTINSWNALKLKDTPLFKDLTPAQQTILFSRTFHQGPGMPKTKVAQEFYGAALRNNWIDAEKYLRNYNVTDKYYKIRVNKEADVLKRERLV